MSVLKYKFDESEQSEVSMSIPAQILSANETGFLIKTSARLAEKTSVKLVSKITQEMGCDKLELKTGLTGTPSDNSQYISDIRIIGVSDDGARHFRKTLKRITK